MSKDQTPLEQLTNVVIKEISNPENHQTRVAGGQKTFHITSTCEQALKTIVKGTESGDNEAKVHLETIEKVIKNMRGDGDDKNLQYANHIEAIINNAKYNHREGKHKQQLAEADIFKKDSKWKTMEDMRRNSGKRENNIER